jgi:hypothetical protein
MDHQHVTNNCYRLQKVLLKSVIQIAIVLDLVGYRSHTDILFVPWGLIGELGPTAPQADMAERFRLLVCLTGWFLDGLGKRDTGSEGKRKDIRSKEEGRQKGRRKIRTEGGRGREEYGNTKKKKKKKKKVRWRRKKERRGAKDEGGGGHNKNLTGERRR